MSWAEFDDRAIRLAWHLKTAAGVEPGDQVAIDLNNRPEYLETFFAALKLGCVPVNVNFRYHGDELQYLLDNSDARPLVHGPSSRDRSATAAEPIAAADAAAPCSTTGEPVRARPTRGASAAARAGRRARPSGDDLSSSTPAAPPACPRA